MFVERFMSWSAAAGADQRAKAVSRLAVKFLNDRIPASSRVETEKALTLYLNDPSVKVRKALARVLCRHDNAPRHMVWDLAQDIVEIACIVYRRSAIFRNSDLIDAVLQGETALQCAIADRDQLDGDTIRALVEHAHESAIRKLLCNPGVVLGPGLKHDIAIRLGEVAEVRSMLLDDHNLAASTRQMLVERLSGSLLNLVRSRGWATCNRLEKAAFDASNRVTVEIAMQSSPHHMGEYVEHLKETNQLTAALLIRASCMGHAALFEMALSLLSGVSLKRVQSIIDEGRISAFSSLYGRTGLPNSAYPVFVAAIEAWQEPQEMPELIAGIISKVENKTQVDGALLSMLERMACEANREAAENYDRQLLIAA